MTTFFLGIYIIYLIYDNFCKERNMSVIKRSKGQMSAFRPAVGLKENASGENNFGDEENQSENQPKLREKLIEDMAQNIIEPALNPKNPLDAISMNVNIAVSPRTKAEWRFVSKQEGRNMSDFIRRAVDFYIRKHGLG
jgi:hypothetical protein